MNLLEYLKYGHATHKSAERDYMNLLLNNAESIPHINERIAWALGAKIECLNPSDVEWSDCKNPRWFDLTKYRIKPPVKHNIDQERFEKLSDEHKRIAMAARVVFDVAYLSMDEYGEAYLFDLMPYVDGDVFNSESKTMLIEKLDSYWTQSDWQNSLINLANVKWEDGK